MKTSIVVVLVLIIVGVNSDCTIDFDEVEEQCSKPIALSPSNVFYYYTRGYAYVDVPKVEEFTSCTWRKWGYQDDNGKINYEKIKQDKLFVWKFSRFCADLLYSYKDYEEAFMNAVSECQDKPPTDITPEKVRTCVVQNYEKYLTAN